MCLNDSCLTVSSSRVFYEYTCFVATAFIKPPVSILVNPYTRSTFSLFHFHHPPIPFHSIPFHSSASGAPKKYVVQTLLCKRWQHRFNTAVGAFQSTRGKLPHGKSYAAVSLYTVFVMYMHIMHVHEDVMPRYERMRFLAGWNGLRLIYIASLFLCCLVLLPGWLQVFVHFLSSFCQLCMANMMVNDSAKSTSNVFLAHILLCDSWNRFLANL